MKNNTDPRKSLHPVDLVVNPQKSIKTKISLCFPTNIPVVKPLRSGDVLHAVPGAPVAPGNALEAGQRRNVDVEELRALFCHTRNSPWHLTSTRLRGAIFPANLTPYSARSKRKLDDGRIERFSHKTWVYMWRIDRRLFLFYVFSCASNGNNSRTQF